jgi:hypothetical protein
MTAAEREQLWQRLRAAGLTEGEMPPTGEHATPWYIRAMLGIAGWIGAWFFIGFIGTALVLVFRSGAVTSAVGALCCATAYALFRVARERDFLPQFALAVSLSGQILVVTGLFTLLDGETGVAMYLAIAAFELVLIALIENFTHRVWCTLAAAVALSLALAEWSAYGIHGLAAGAIAATFAGIWLNEHKWVKQGSLWRPVGYGVAFALVWFDAFGLAAQAIGSAGGPSTIGSLAAWAGAVIAGLVFVLSIHRLLTQHDVAPASRVGRAALAAAGTVAVLTTGAPGVVVSLLILIIGFAGGHRTLFGLGVAALLGYLSWFYYSLHVTLLTKSLVLVATGVVLIAAWAAMRALVGEPDDEAAHA